MNTTAGTTTLHNICSTLIVCHSGPLLHHPPAASYDFLHDVMAPCAATRARSPYRQAMFNKFWSHLQAMRHSDQLLEHLHSFSSSPTLYTVPGMVRSGGPLFFLSETTGAPEPFSG